MSETVQLDLVASIHQAAAACNVTPIVVRRWMARGWLPEPPWTAQQLHEVRDLTDPGRRLRGPGAAHGTETRWTQGCNCDPCRKAKTDAERAADRRKAHKRLPVEVRQQLLDAIRAGKPFRATVLDLGLTSNQVWGLAKTDEHWAAELEAELMASRRDDLKHGTNAAYVHGCVCSDCRAQQRIRMDTREPGDHEAADQHHGLGDVQDPEFISCVRAAPATRADHDFHSFADHPAAARKAAYVPNDVVGTAGSAVAATEPDIVESRSV